MQAKRRSIPSRIADGTETIFGEGASAVLAARTEADVVVNGASGFAALKPLLTALEQGKRVALANKESIVCGKKLVDETKKRFGGEIIPVDSEQSAIFQCLQNGRANEVERLILTASGGPFWRLERAALEQVTLEQALAHPTWNMGKKITIDSATLFNKGLEVIEAAYLFDIPGEQIEVLIHPQSIVHSMVAYRDGTCMANMSRPDMRLPIQYAITYPARNNSSVSRFCCNPNSHWSFLSLIWQGLARSSLPTRRSREGSRTPLRIMAQMRRRWKHFAADASGLWTSNGS